MQENGAASSKIGILMQDIAEEDLAFTFEE